MATIFDLQARGLRHSVIVDAAVAQATLDDLDRRGLRYKAEVASGVTAADKATLDRRGLRYFVPVAVGVAEADRASLDRQGLRYAVQVDADILPADRAALERQGLRYFVEVDSSGNAIATAVGGAILLADEANGFATDFTHAVDAERVAVKTAGTVVASTVDGFYQNAGTSPKQIFDVSGNLVWSPHNLVLQSQAFDNASWIKNALTITANAIAAPDGTMTAEACIPSAGTVSPYATQGITVANGAVVTFSVYAKNGTLGTSWFLIQIDSGGNKSAWFNLATGLKGSISGATTSNMVVLANGWYRCDVTFTAGAASAQPYLAMASSNGGGAGSTTGDGVKPAFYLWGAQLNRGSVPTAYLPTTTAARYGLAIDYDPVTHAAKGLLCEPAATNLHVQSNDLSALVFNNATITVNNQTGPDGTATADTFTEDTATSTHGGYGSATTVAATDYTFSRYIKMGTRRYATISLSDGTNGCYAVFDLQSGVVGSSAALGSGTRTSASIQACQNGWYRCILVGRNPGTTTYYLVASANAASYTPVDGHGRQSFTGTSSTLFFGLGQVEVGTVATSPIPTPTGATVTRAKDNYNFLPASINFSATAGSWWVETYLLEGSIDRYIIGGHNGFSPLYYNQGAYSMLDTSQLYILTSPLNVTRKAMSAFQSGSRAITTNGLAPSTDAGATSTLLAPTILAIGGYPSGSATSPTLGYIRKVRYLPRRPSNAEMQTMTT